jgi:23S rRNA (guanosine2251-2'-O)-methyltransferase
MKKDIVLVLPNIRSLHNVGSFFRTADAFGVSKIYLCGYTGTPDSKSAKNLTKVSLGAENYIPWEYSKTTAPVLKKLKAEGYTIVCLEQAKTSQPLNTVGPLAKIALVVGNEVKGLSKSLLAKADIITEIPMLGKKESLNVSVAGGIALYALMQA